MKKIIGTTILTVLILFSISMLALQTWICTEGNWTEIFAIWGGLFGFGFLLWLGVYLVNYGEETE